MIGYRSDHESAGLDETLDAEGVAEATRILMPEDADIRQPSASGAKVASTPDADAQNRLLEFLGRHP